MNLRIVLKYACKFFDISLFDPKHLSPHPFLWAELSNFLFLMKKD